MQRNVDAFMLTQSDREFESLCALLKAGPANAEAVARIEMEAKSSIVKAAYVAIERAEERVAEAERKAEAFERKARIYHRLAAEAGLVVADFQLTDASVAEEGGVENGEGEERERAGADEDDALWVEESDGEEWGVEEKEDEEGRRRARICYRKRSASLSDDSLPKKPRMNEKEKKTAENARKEWAQVGWLSDDEKWGEKAAEERRLVGTISRKRSATIAGCPIQHKVARICRPVRWMRKTWAALTPKTARVSSPAPPPITAPPASSVVRAPMPPTNAPPASPVVPAPLPPTTVSAPCTAAPQALPPTASKASPPVDVTQPTARTSTEYQLRKLRRLQRAVKKGRVFEPAARVLTASARYPGRAPPLLEKGEVLITRSARAIANAAQAAKAKQDTAYQLALLRLPVRVEYLPNFEYMEKARRRHLRAYEKLRDAVDTVIEVGNVNVRAGRNRDERTPGMKKAAARMEMKAGAEKAFRAIFTASTASILK